MKKQEIQKTYNPKEIEDNIYKHWEESGFFNPDNLSRKDKGVFSVMMAPPNITGNLHMGHALENTMLDILVRFHRMSGYDTLWVPGVDHAGISAQSKVEKELAKQDIYKKDLSREEFIEKMQDWKNKNGSIILDQIRKLGFSVDWSRLSYTMDPNYQEAVKTAFNRYHDKGWIYKGKRIINWSVKDQTSLSDLEIYFQEEKSHLWFIKYPFKDWPDKYITVATVRPETMLGDTAVAVNPNDERYRELVGKKVILPITNREVPIVADKIVETDFGTGAVKVTPAHDSLDFEIGQRHKLDSIEVINRYGKIVDEFHYFAGLKITEARESVIAKLKELGAIEKVEDYTHSVAYGERCHTVIEPLLSEQWFLKMDELAQKAIVAIEAEEIKYHPSRWSNIALNWLKNVRDWNISRQIYWGHPIPKEGETDVLDTWFSSALWPFATLGWPTSVNTANVRISDLERYYPTSVITSDRGILHLWITRMIFSGLEFTGRVPFRDILIHGTILTKDGKRMSKSLGTGLDPLDFVEKYGADAVRFGLIYQSIGQQQDIKFGEEFIRTGGKFANKLWNIFRYIDDKVGDESCVPSDAPPPWIMSRTQEIEKEVTNHIQQYRFGEALHMIYDFTWHEFADKFVEESKSKDDDDTKNALRKTLTSILHILHPFMPFVTEEIWSRLPSWPEKKNLIIEKWPI